MLARSYIRVTCGLQLPPVGESGAAAAALLGGDADKSRLREVMIAGERLRQAHTAHDDKTGGIDQRPLLVALLLQQRPGRRVQIGSIWTRFRCVVRLMPLMMARSSGRVKRERTVKRAASSDRM